MRSSNEEFKNIFHQLVELFNKNNIWVLEVVNRKVSTYLDKISNTQIFLKPNMMNLKYVQYVQ